MDFCTPIVERDLHFVGHHVVPQPSGLHVVLIDVGTYDFLSVGHNSLNFDAKLLLFCGSIVVVFTTFNNAVQLFVGFARRRDKIDTLLLRRRP